LTAEYAWLAEAFAGIAAINGWDETEVEGLRGLSERLLHGVPAEGLELAGARVRGLGRAGIAALVEAGFTGLQEIADAPRGEIEKLVTRPVAARLLARAAALLDLILTICTLSYAHALLPQVAYGFRRKGASAANCC
jgi:hypothetical protein